MTQILSITESIGGRPAPGKAQPAVSSSLHGVFVPWRGISLRRDKFEPFYARPQSNPADNHLEVTSMRERIRHLILTCASAALVFSLSGIPGAAQQKDDKIKYELRDFLGLQIPAGLDVFALRIPADNPVTPEKIELGKLLFFDRALSQDNTVSCADCHHPDLAFTDGRPVSTGIRGQKGGRSAPTLINRAFSASQFWDGRASSLEQQAKGPMLDPLEMGNRSHEDIVVRLERLTGYKTLFKEAFGTDAITIDRVAQAIATFERTLLSGNSAFDRYQRGDAGAISASARRGF